MKKKKPAPLSLGPAATRRLVGSVRRAGASFARAYPGETGARQPVHTVYGGAQLFRSTRRPSSGRWRSKPSASTPPRPAPSRPRSASRPEGRPPAEFAAVVHARVKAKLEREPVEDFRIDFEDGYGNRPDAEEDGHAAGRRARGRARACGRGTLPPFIGIRIKPLTRGARARAACARSTSS